MPKTAQITWTFVLCT